MTTSYAIITTDANNAVLHLHNRMRVTLRAEDYGEWLTVDDPRELLKRRHNETIYAYPVSTRVNVPKNNDNDVGLIAELQAT